MPSEGISYGKEPRRGKVFLWSMRNLIYFIETRRNWNQKLDKTKQKTPDEMALEISKGGTNTLGHCDQG